MMYVMLGSIFHAAVFKIFHLSIFLPNSLFSRAASHLHFPLR
jgi:hypothetical protein